MIRAIGLGSKNVCHEKRAIIHGDGHVLLEYERVFRACLVFSPAQKCRMNDGERPQDCRHKKMPYSMFRLPGPRFVFPWSPRLRGT